MRTRIKWTRSRVFDGFQAPDRMGGEKPQTLIEHSTQPLPRARGGCFLQKIPPYLSSSHSFTAILSLLLSHTWYRPDCICSSLRSLSHPVYRDVLQSLRRRRPHWGVGDVAGLLEPALTTRRTRSDRAVAGAPLHSRFLYLTRGGRTWPAVGSAICTSVSCDTRDKWCAAAAAHDAGHERERVRQ